MPAAPAAPAPPPAPAQSPAAPARTTAAPAPAKPAASAPAAPAKVTNPFDDSFADLDRYASADEPEVPQPSAQKPSTPGKPVAGPGAKKPAAKPATPPAPKPGETAPTDETPADETTGKPGEAKSGEISKPGETPKPGQESAWKLVESYKKTNRTLEKELAELRAAQGKPAELPKEHLDRFTALETRNKELEEEIRHVNYTKSSEFKEKFDQPYQDAWHEMAAEVKQLKVALEDGTTRPGNSQDILKICNLETGEARELADAMFGKCADDVMDMRRQLIRLSNARDKAIESARKNAAERDQQRTLEQQARAKANAEATSKLWNEINTEAVGKYEFLRPVEGETERNQKLEAATKFVDDTFALNINSAKTEAEREQILRQHAAVRNRAIAYSVLKMENKGLRAQLAELKATLAEYQGSEPTNGEPTDRGGGGDPAADTLEGAVAGLAKLAS